MQDEMLPAAIANGDRTGGICRTDTPFGSMKYLPNDDLIGRSLDNFGEWARIEIDFLGSFLVEGDTVVDVGAYIGTHTIAFARLVGSSGRVISIEPQPKIFELLTDNVKANDLGNVELVQAGLGSGSGTAFLASLNYDGHADFGGVRLTDVNVAQSNSIKVPIVALDEYNLASCRLIKIDAKGMEADVLNGMAETIKKCGPFIYAGYNTIEEGVKIIQILRPYGYRLSLVAAAVYNPGNLAGCEENWLGVARESSLLCMPPYSREAIPASTNACSVRPFGTLEEFAVAHLAVPRFGDTSEHDRDISYLREHLTLATDLAANLGALEEAHREEATRLLFRVNSLTKQLEKSLRAEEKIKAVLFEEISAAIDAVRSDAVTAAEARANARIDHIYASTSWLITKPLRYIRRLVSGIIGHLTIR